MTVVIGTPEFGECLPASFRVWGDTGSIAPGDLNGDGRIDIAHAGARNSVSLLFNQATLLITTGPDPSTLSWRLTVGTTSHEVYRGGHENLTDVDTDGLPDHGYGACISLEDLDPGDNAL